MRGENKRVDVGNGGKGEGKDKLENLFSVLLSSLWWNVFFFGVRFIADCWGGKGFLKN